MNKFQHKLLTMAIAIFLLPTGSSQADIVITVDADAKTPGVQSVGKVADSEEFEVAIGMILSDTDSLATYAFRVRYDSDELTLISKSQSPPDGFVVADDDNNRDGDDETRFADGSNFMETQVGAIDLTFSAEPVRGASVVDVATLTFRANRPQDDGIDLVTLFNPIFDGMFDADLNPVSEDSITFGSASITAVPEPAFLPILLCGLVAPMLVRRKRQDCLT